MTAKVRTCLWFDGNGEEAAKFYVSLLPDSAIEKTFSPTDGAPPLVVDFTLGGTPYQILNAGPQHPLSEAVSISVSTTDQPETDRLWAALLADGGREIQCGWLKDRFGLFWQIVPEALPRLLASPDKATSARVMQAMMKMIKIDIAGIEAAARNS
jgi:predicted 3-demethylubiquinone-9 3-methyltransferase (glyoxalase superfamily)